MIKYLSEVDRDTISKPSAWKYTYQITLRSLSKGFVENPNELEAKVRSIHDSFITFVVSSDTNRGDR